MGASPTALGRYHERSSRNHCGLGWLWFANPLASGENSGRNTAEQAVSTGGMMMAQDYSELLKRLDAGFYWPECRNHSAIAIRALVAENEMLREALKKIAEEGDAGRHDGLPE